MAGTIRMRATEALDNDGQRVRAGQAFSTTPAKAASLRYLRKATFIDEQTHRRDQRAEQSEREPEPEREPAAVTAATDVEPDAPAEGRRGGRGSYRRRDLRAEDSEKA